MKQKTPIIKDDDIERIIKREYSFSNTDEVKLLLHLYNPESKEGRNRVYASILKLANGDIEMLKQYIAQANEDFRDIITSSEYPNYSEYAFDDSLSEKEKEQLILKDWEQYTFWLNK